MKTDRATAHEDEGPLRLLVDALMGRLTAEQVLEMNTIDLATLVIAKAAANEDGQFLSDEGVLRMSLADTIRTAIPGIDQPGITRTRNVMRDMGSYAAIEGGEILEFRLVDLTTTDEESLAGAVALLTAYQRRRGIAPSVGRAEKIQGGGLGAALAATELPLPTDSAAERAVRYLRRPSVAQTAAIALIEQHGEDAADIANEVLRALNFARGQ